MPNNDGMTWLELQLNDQVDSERRKARYWRRQTARMTAYALALVVIAIAAAWDELSTIAARVLAWWPHPFAGNSVEHWIGTGALVLLAVLGGLAVMWPRRED